MNIQLKVLRHLAWVFAFIAASAQTEDIDIFAGTRTVDTGLPNVVFVLDNTANWSRQGQQWPDGDTQGESELIAIKQVLASAVNKLNVGLMMYEAEDSSENDGGYTRFDLQPLDPNAYLRISNILDNIDVNDETEKVNASNAYGVLPEDFYNYLAGRDQSNDGDATTSIADEEAYQSNYDTFESPLTADSLCADTYMIYIGNNKNGNVAGDDSRSSTALHNAYIDAGFDEGAPNALAQESGGTPLGMPEFTTVESTEEVCTGGEPTDGGTEYFGGYTIPASATSDCYRSNKLGDCAAAECPADAPDGTCSCAAPTLDDASCGNRELKYTVTVDTWEVVTPPGTTPVVCEDVTTTVSTPTGDVNTTLGRSYNMDDWTEFMFNVGVRVQGNADIDGDGVEEPFDERVKVKTYTIDVFNKQDEADLSSLWFSAANAGGGRYFQAKSQQAIIDAIESAFGDIISKASAFSAVTLPLSSTNQRRVDNEVYIGMFRPAPGKKPRWYGNLKRYQLALFNGDPRLADVNLNLAINPQTGFARDCSESFWSEDSNTYWQSLGVEPTMESECSAAVSASKQWSDLPDGPFVEKGGVAQQIRQLSAGSSRKLLTVAAGLIANVTDDAHATAVGGQSVLDYFRGDSVGADGEGVPGSGLRPSIHGDVIHSRPLTVRYDADTVVAFYGANDGLYRAVSTDSGEELWGLVAPEHMGQLERLYDNDPYVDFEGASQEDDLTYEKKDYFFDGPTGLVVDYAAAVSAGSSGVGALERAYIYPTMRRGGRMVYGINVTDPNDPQLLWRHGCEDDTADNCTTIANPAGFTNDGTAETDFSNIGQTWSTPIGATIEEYPGSAADPNAVVIFGGGFDDCLNADDAAYPGACSTANGKGVYVLDAVTGDLVQYFETDAPVITDIAVVDVDVDGAIEFAYVGDAKGNLYRIRFADLVTRLPLGDVPDNAITARVHPSDYVDGTNEKWIIEKIAYVPSYDVGGKAIQPRFFNSPAAAVLPGGGGKIGVTIGTGDRERPLEANYPYAEDVQNKMYFLADDPNKDWAAEVAAGLEMPPETWTRTALNLEGVTMFDVEGDTFEADEDFTSFDGWYFDLPDANVGEQVANPAVIGGKKVFFNTFQPGGPSTGICSEPIGVGRSYAIDWLNPEPDVGTEIAGGGLPIPPIIATVKIPPGCIEDNCTEPPAEDPCAAADNECEVRTICIGCDGFEPIPIDPLVDPTLQRVYRIEDMDRLTN